MTDVDMGRRRTNTFLGKGGEGRGCQREEENQVKGTYPLDIVRRRDGEGKEKYNVDAFISVEDECEK